MIAHLKGVLTQKNPDGIIIDVHGVGYETSVSLNTFYRLPKAGEEVTLLTHTHVTESSSTLYGFLEQQEKDLFKILISVSGIGPKVGLAMLSGLAPSDLMTAISTKNVAQLTSVNGIGKKTAERIIMELKDKVQPFQAKGLAEGEQGEGLSPLDSTYKEALSALINLGYQRSLAEQALSQINFGAHSTLEIVLKESLGVLSR